MGTGPALFLRILEGHLGAPIASQLAWGAGTSVGAINIAMLAAGYSSRDLHQLYQQHLKGIFGTVPWRYRLTKCGPRYDDTYVVNLLKEKLGGRTMGDTLFPVFITSWDVRKRDLKVFGPDDMTVPLWYAARCSLAAPTYFSAQERRYEDGGVAANDPSLVGLSGAIKTRVASGMDAHRILALVTTGTTPEGPEVEPNRFTLNVLTKEVLPALTAGNSSDVEYILQAWAESIRDRSGDFQHLRICPPTPDFDLDQVDHAGEVDIIWEKAWKDHGDAVKILLGA